MDVELYKTSPIQIDLDDQSIETLNATLQFEVVKTGDSFSVRGYSGALDAEHLIFNEVVKALPAKIPRASRAPTAVACPRRHSARESQTAFFATPIRAFCNRYGRS